MSKTRVWLTAPLGKWRNARTPSHPFDYSKMTSEQAALVWAKWYSVRASQLSLDLTRPNLPLLSRKVVSLGLGLRACDSVLFLRRNRVFRSRQPSLPPRSAYMLLTVQCRSHPMQYSTPQVHPADKL